MTVLDKSACNLKKPYCNLAQMKKILYRQTAAELPETKRIKNNNNKQEKKKNINFRDKVSQKSVWVLNKILNWEHTLRRGIRYSNDKNTIRAATGKANVGQMENCSHWPKYKDKCLYTCTEMTGWIPEIMFLDIYWLLKFVARFGTYIYHHHH